jgi:hypothetical protein
MSKATKRPGRPTTAALRWNLQQASREFGVNRETLERRRRAKDLVPGEDGCFSTKQIAALVMGDDQAQAYLELTRAKAERERVQTEILRKERWPREDVGELLTTTFSNVRGIILASRLDDQSKDDLITELREADLLKKLDS